MNKKYLGEILSVILILTTITSAIQTAGAVTPRVYDESIQPAIGSTQLPSYKWDAQSFQGFWYNLKTGVLSESLEIGGPLGNTLTTTIDHSTRAIPVKTLVYQTTRQAVQYKVSEKAGSVVLSALDSNFNKISTGAGYYAKIGWMGDEYVALNGHANKLAKLVLEHGAANSEKKTLITGESWEIGDGYILTAQSIDARATPRQVWFVLSRFGATLDAKVVGQGSVYTYVERNISGELDVPVFVTYVDSVFAGATSDMVQLKYTWLISKDAVTVNVGDRFGMIKVIGVGNGMIVLRNEDSSVDLSVNSEISLMGNIKFKVADDNNFLRFTLQKAAPVQGIYQIRGTAHDEGNPAYANLLKWDGQNFEGFLYDLRTGVSGESLEIGGPFGNSLTTPIDHNGRTIPVKSLVYRTTRQAAQYPVNEKTGLVIENALDNNFNKVSTGAGYYAKIGWLGGEYVAPNGQANKFANLILEHGTSSSDKKTLAIGETWEMGGGYKLTVRSIDVWASPRLVWLVLSRDGVNLEDKIVSQGSVYTYAGNISEELEVPLFVTYIDSVFAGATTDMVQLRYTWLVSDYATIVNAGERLGLLSVKEANTNGLTSWNEDLAIDLPVDSTVDIAGNMKFRVADDESNLRFYPLIEHTYGSFSTITTPVTTAMPTVTATTTPTPGNIVTGLVNGTVTRSLSVASVAPGGTLTVTLTPTANVYGTYTWQAAETLPAGFTFVSSGDVYATQAGQVVTMTPTVGIGGVITYTVTAPNISGTYTFSGTFKDENLGIGNVKGSSVILVGFPSSGTVTRSISPLSVTSNGTLTITLTPSPASTFDAPGYRVIETIPEGFTYLGTSAGAAVEGNVVTLTQAGSSPISYTLRATSTNGTHSISGTFRDELTNVGVVAGTTGIRVGAGYDTNGNGVIDRNEAIHAVMDYFNGVVTRQEAIDVVLAFFRG